MCGIAGIITSGAPVERSSVLSMSNRLVHRGPDDEQWFLDGPCGLAHSRLAIIDLAGGGQPMISPDGNLVLIANAEIYNYRELRSELDRRGRCCSSQSDCEVILHAYLEWGLQSFSRLRGMFAFALYDKREQRLVLVRDRLGIKPLYWVRSGNRLLFASEMKGLLPELQNSELSLDALVQYLGYGYSSGESTPVHGISRLSPGHALIVDRDLKTKSIEYWSLNSISARELSFEQSELEFSALMEVVMRQHLQADVPFGLFLSGGVDSSTLLALAARYCPGRLRTYSVGFADAVHSELADAETTARRFGTDHTSLVLGQTDLLEHVPYMVWAADDLILDYAMLPTSLLAEVAGKDVKVVITGEGGDEVFAGYGRYRKPPALRALRGWLAPQTGGFRSRGAWSRAWANRVFADGLLKARGFEQTALRAAWKAAPAEWNWLKRCQYTDLRTELADSLLPKVDRMLMASGIEGRVPLLDHRVVEFGLALPDALKVAPRQGKVFLKRWSKTLLPGEMLTRPKRGFSVPMPRLLTTELLELLAERLPHNRALTRYFKPEGIKQLIASQRAHGNMTKQIWSLIQIALWHRLFIEGDGAAPPRRSVLTDWL